MAALVNFTGLASGIDSNALIEALLDQQRQTQIIPLQDKIADLQDTNSALDELKTLIGTLSSAASKFRVVNGGALSKTASSSDESIVTASAGNAAQSGVYNLTVNQLASNATFSFDDRFSTTGAVIDSGINNGDPEADRTVSFTVGSGSSSETIDIVLTDSTTASEFVSSFNESSELATASLVNMGTAESPSYAIVVNTQNEGVDKGSFSVDSVGAGISAFATYDLDQADDANFSIDGISGTITRSSNTVSDVINGLSFKLESTGTATISIAPDPDTTQSSVQDFVDAYNEIVNFIAENDLITRDDSGGKDEITFGALTSTALDESIMSSIRSDLSASGLSGNTINILADLGVTTDRDGTLAFDTDKFTEAISSEPASVESILENVGEALAAVDGTLAQYTRFGGLLDQTTNSNDTQISNYENRIGIVEKNLAEQETSLMNRYARLESLIAQMNSQQSTLASILPAA